MVKRFFILITLVALLGALFALTPQPAAQAATLRQAAASTVLTPDALANITYQSQLAPDGTVQLQDGKYEDTANRLTVMLVPAPMAYGTIDGQDAAAVLIAENGGGSGVFTNLELVVDQDGTPVNVAMAVLGDRIDPLSLAIENDQIIVSMVTQGPDEPMCCPTQIVEQIYALDDDGQLTLVDETVVGSVPQVTVANVDTGYSQAVAPATPYDDSRPPFASGAPAHMVIAFGDDDPRTAMDDGKPYIAVYPAVDYATLWADAGDMAVTDDIASLEKLLAERPANPEPPLPILPPALAVNDLAAQVQYLDGDGYSGVRFIGRTMQEKEPVLNGQLNYYFQGLSSDGQYLIVAQAPISTTAAPDSAQEIPAAVQQVYDANFTTYLSDTTAALNELADEEWDPAPSTLDAVLNSLTIGGAATSALTPDALANMTYNATMTADGTAPLSNGVYTETIAPDSASVTQVMLVPEPMAFGQVDGQDAAAVLIAENGGGSGTFISLHLVVDQDGVPVDAASTLLGDRVRVSNLKITDDGLIIVDMVAQGPNDPMCCPSMPTTQAYALIGDQLVLVSQVGAAVDPADAANLSSAAVIQATPYDDSQPPGPQGEPKHAVFAFDGDATTAMAEGNPYVAIYSVPAYEMLWNDAGNSTVSNMLASLQTLLADQPANPEAPLPFLPPLGARNDLATQVEYLTLADGGTGMRWVGRVSQDASPIAASQLRYYFQGLSADGLHLIAAQFPVTTTALPATNADIPADVQTQAADDFAAYMQATAETLEGLSSTDFTPDLAALDALLQSTVVQMYINPLLPDALGNIAYQVQLVDGGVVTLTNGTYEDSANQIVVTLAPQPIAYGRLDEQDAAAVLLAENGGGSGVFVDLEAVVDQDGAPVNVAMAPLGDRVQVNSLTIADNQITVGMVTQGPNDPMCCPTQVVTQVYELQGDQLVKISESTGTATATAGGGGRSLLPITWLALRGCGPAR